MKPDKSRTYPVAVAPNGARRTLADHPRLPLSAKAMAETASAIVDVGASLIHVHVRDQNLGHVLDAGLYRATSEAIRGAVGERLIIQITTEAVGRYQPEAQMAVVRDVRPEAASLAVRELCAHADQEPEFASFLRFLRRERIAGQYIVYDVDDVLRLVDLVKRGVVPEARPEVLYVLGRYAVGQKSRPEELLPLLAAAGDYFPDFMVCAFGQSEAACGAAAVLLGGGARLGFENNLALPGGGIAGDNAELITAMAGPLGELGWVPAPVDLLRNRYAARFA
jgi:3-keto-5-aminohexanoate cleavage enzyme